MSDHTLTVDEAARRLSGLSTAGWARLSEPLREGFRIEVYRIVEQVNTRDSIECKCAAGLQCGACMTGAIDPVTKTLIPAASPRFVTRKDPSR